MVKIRTISSEVDIQNEIYRSFKYNLIFDQISFYLENGANIFYNKTPQKIFKKYSEITAKFGDEIIKKITNKTDKLSIISLGCGNSEVEKKFLNQLYKEKYNFSYSGIDSSMTMIEQAQDNLGNTEFEKQFIYANFSSEKFIREYDQILEPGTKKIFAFLGGTLGNVPQNYIANTLRNILKKGDILWIAVKAQKELTNEIANEYFKSYLERIQNKNDIKFLTNPLINYGIPIEKGRLSLEMLKEPSINTLIFKFSFIVKEEIEFEKNKEKITLLKGDSIDLITNRVYELESLRNFFEKREFKEINQISDGDIIQIAFEKQ